MFSVILEVIMKRNICFFEPDEKLAGKLIDYWLDHGLIGYNICYYSDEARWLADCQSLSPELWILDNRLREFVDQIHSGRIVWWSDRPEETDSLFKYRSAAILLHAIKGYLGTESVEKGTDLISLYSPIKRCHQTTFGITLSHLLSKKGRVLYLNLEGYSGFERSLTDAYSKDISDFIYYVNQKSENIPLLIQKYVYRLSEIDIIPPVLNPANLQDISEDMWLNMLDILRKSGLYDYIIVDVSDYIQGTFSVLRESHIIFSLIKSDSQACAKWQQYSSVLMESGYGDVLNKTRTSEAPYVSVCPVDFQDGLQGPMLEFVTKAAREAGLL
jgi:hypothetical protein